MLTIQRIIYKSHINSLTPAMKWVLPIAREPWLFRFGSVVQIQREQRGGSEAILRQGGVADGGLKGASGTVVCLTGGSGRGGRTR